MQAVGLTRPVSRDVRLSHDAWSATSWSARIALGRSGTARVVSVWFLRVAQATAEAQAKQRGRWVGPEAHISEAPLERPVVLLSPESAAGEASHVLRGVS